MTSTGRSRTALDVITETIQRAHGVRADLEKSAKQATAVLAALRDEGYVVVHAAAGFEAALADLGCTVHDTDKAALLAWLDSDECKAWEAADPLDQPTDHARSGS